MAHWATVGEVTADIVDLVGEAAAAAGSAVDEAAAVVEMAAAVAAAGMVPLVVVATACCVSLPYACKLGRLCTCTESNCHRNY